MHIKLKIELHKPHYKTWVNRKGKQFLFHWWHPSNNIAEKTISGILLTFKIKLTRQGVTRGAGTANPSGGHEFTIGFIGVYVTQYLVFYVIFCRSLFVILFSFLCDYCIVCPSIDGL
jgi:hypothetical protein